MGQKFLGQARFADTTFALQRDDSTVGADRGVAIEKRRPFRRPPDQRVFLILDFRF
jgi:hypothetical protein